MTRRESKFNTGHFSVITEEMIWGIPGKIARVHIICEWLDHDVRLLHHELDVGSFGSAL